MNNQYEIRGTTAYIKVFCKGVEMETLVDAEDIPKLLSYGVNWRAQFYKTNRSYYVTAVVHDGSKRRQIFLHRFLMNAPKNKKIDHLHHDTLDNRKSQLKIVTHQENMQNVKARGKSGYRGVYWLESSKKWRAHLSFKGKKMHIGYFDKLEEANEAVKLARAKYMPESTEGRMGLDHSNLIIPKARKARKQSGVQGITWNERQGVWRVCVRVKGKQEYIGVFKRLNDAKKYLKNYNKTLTEQQTLLATLEAELAALEK